jgi:hypothetical protein
VMKPASCPALHIYGHSHIGVGCIIAMCFLVKGKLATLACMHTSAGSLARPRTDISIDVGCSRATPSQGLPPLRAPEKDHEEHNDGLHARRPGRPTLVRVHREDEGGQWFYTRTASAGLLVVVKMVAGAPCRGRHAATAGRPGLRRYSSQGWS